MANVKISELLQINQADLDSADIITLVDVDDATMAATGSNKRATLLDFAGAVGDRLVGWQDFADTTTSVAPLQITSATGGTIQLTNDSSGILTDGNTNVNANSTVSGVSDLYNSSNNFVEYNATGIEANDVILFRTHLRITPNTVPCDVDMKLTFYNDVAGGGTEQFSLNKHIATITSNAGVVYEVIDDINYFIGASIVNGSNKIEITTNAAADIEVVGYNINIIKNS
jgi:hypothetical protein